jgi:hypothetical protein
MAVILRLEIYPAPVAVLVEMQQRTAPVEDREAAEVAIPLGLQPV